MNYSNKANKTTFIHAKVITPWRILNDYAVKVENGKIIEVQSSESIDLGDAGRLIDVEGNYLVPGFIDIHLHGGGGYEFMSGKVESIKGISDFHVKHGTTSMVLSTSCAPLDKTYCVLDAFREAIKTPSSNNLIGVHLEGPFLSPLQSGAMITSLIKPPCEQDIMNILSYKDIVIRISAAPEVEGTIALAQKMREYGILMSIGHSDGTSEDLLYALESGFTHITHFYSAMSMVKRVNAFRIPGMIEGAYLSDGYTIELIADGRHLPADLLKLAYKVKGPERTALITDAIWAAGTPDGQLVTGPGEREILVEDGVAKLPDRSVFAGSTSTMDRIVKTMVQLADVPLIEAIRMASATPARIIGISKHKGTINVGMDADLVVLDHALTVKSVMVEGKEIVL